MYMILSSLQFYTFLPTLIAWFGAYSFARIFDTSWGNRPSNQMNDIRDKEMRQLVENDFRRTSHTITTSIVFINIVLALFLELNAYNTQAIALTVLFTFAFITLHLALSVLYVLWYRCWVPVVAIYRKFRPRNYFDSWQSENQVLLP